MNSQSKKNSVVVFGTGEFGKVVHHCLLQANYSVSAFIDLNPRNIGETFEGQPVIGISTDINEKIVLASNRNNYSHLYSILKKHNLDDVEECDKYLGLVNFSELKVNWSKERVESEIKTHLARSRNRSSDGRGVWVNSIDIVVTEKCSLKCKDCSNLMQYYEAPVTAQSDPLLGDISAILRSVERVGELRFIGGEPLLFKVIEHTCNFQNFEELVIFTNGTIVPKPEQLSVLQDSRIRFQISNYGAISRRVEKLVSALEEAGIRFVNDRVTTWQDCAKIEKKERNREETEAVFANCCVNDAFTLLHGKVYGCPFAAHAENLAAIPVSASDSFSVADWQERGITEGFVELMRQTSYWACDYCNGRDYTVSKVEAAVQVKSPIPYQRVVL